MLKPSSLVNVRINVAGQQNLDYKRNAEDAAYTAALIVANLSKADVTAEKVKEASTTMGTTFYNQFTNKTVYEKSTAPKDTPEDQILDDDKFYTVIAHGIPDLSYVEIGDVKKKADETVRVSIGNNGFVVAPIWKIDEKDDLKVATVFLGQKVDITTGKTAVTAGGITYEVPVMDAVAENKLKIKSVMVNNVNEGSNSTVSIQGSDIYAVLDRFDQSVCVEFADGDESITDTDMVIYPGTVGTSSVTMDKLAVRTNGVTAAGKYMFPYAARKVNENEAGQERTATVCMILPGHGTITYTIHAVTMYTAE